MKLQVEETTIRELSEMLIPHHKNSKLAKSAAEYMVSACSDQLCEQPKFDIGTLRAFVDFLIKKGYN